MMDRPVQASLVLVLLEADFKLVSCGLRPRRWAWDAIAGIQNRGSGLYIGRSLPESTPESATKSAPESATHRSRTSMAKHYGLSKSTVGRICTGFRLKSHWSKTFKLSMDRCSSRRSATASYLDGW
jgi:hypothetical protein